MGLRGPVMVGTDLSDASAEALRAGAELARALQSRMFVCHVVPDLLPAGSLFEQFRMTNRQASDAVFASARLAVDTQLRAVLTAGGADDIGVVLDTGTPHVGLLRQAAQLEAGVVVVAPSSAAVDVVRHAAAAVLVARRSPHGPVVGATDFSDASLPALQVAGSEAARRGADLHLLHAFDVTPFAERRPPAAALPYLEGRSSIALEGLGELRALAMRRLEDELQRSGRHGEAVIVAGPATDVIVAHAESVLPNLWWWGHTGAAASSG